MEPGRAMRAPHMAKRRSGIVTDEKHDWSVLQKLTKDRLDELDDGICRYTAIRDSLTHAVELGEFLASINSEQRQECVLPYPVVQGALDNLSKRLVNIEDQLRSFSEKRRRIAVLHFCSYSDLDAARLLLQREESLFFYGWAKNG